MLHTLGYVSKSRLIFSRWSVYRPTSQACIFSKVRFIFVFLRKRARVNDGKEKKEAERGSGSYTHEDPGSGINDVDPKSTNPSNAQLGDLDAFMIRYARWRFHWHQLEVIIDIRSW